MSKKKILIIGIIISFGLQSCDCFIIVNGNIVDSQTNEPIIDAQIEFLNVKSIDYSKSTDSLNVNRVFKTDSLGHFFMNSSNYGFCPDLKPKIKIWKEGYKTEEYMVEKDAERNELNEITIKLGKK